MRTTFTRSFVDRLKVEFQNLGSRSLASFNFSLFSLIKEAFTRIYSVVVSFKKQYLSVSILDIKKILSKRILLARSFVIRLQI